MNHKEVKELLLADPEVRKEWERLQQEPPEPPEIVEVEPRPAFWIQCPQEYFGRDPEGRDYWLMFSNVYRTENTGTVSQRTTWVSAERPFRAVGITRYNVRKSDRKEQ